MPFSKKQYEILAALYPDREISVNDLQNTFGKNDYIVSSLRLSKERLIHVLEDNGNYLVRLTEKGRALVESKYEASVELKFTRKYKKSTLWTARIALIISIIDLIWHIVKSL